MSTLSMHPQDPASCNNTLCKMTGMPLTAGASTHTAGGSAAGGSAAGGRGSGASCCRAGMVDEDMKPRAYISTGNEHCTIQHLQTGCAGGKPYNQQLKQGNLVHSRLKSQAPLMFPCIQHCKNASPFRAASSSAACWKAGSSFCGCTEVLPPAAHAKQTYRHTMSMLST